MRATTLLRRNLTYFWRTNLAVVAGAAIAVSVLAGAAMVGDSMRASLRELFLQRLGKTDVVVAGSGFFREELAAAFSSSCPLIALEGLVSRDDGRRAYGVAVYGVDHRFWQFHGLAPRETHLTEALARELGVKSGDSVVVRVGKPSAIPAEWLHGRKEDASRALRLRAGESAPPFDFALRAGQGDVRAIFVPLRRLQRDLGLMGKVNTLLAGGSQPVEEIVRREFTLADLGIKVRGVSVESDSALINDALADAVERVAKDMGLAVSPVFTYLANTIRIREREIPYSLGAATGPTQPEQSSILLNEWAARDLQAKPGDTVTLDYYLWK
ncbi:MAG: hypothetical protein HYR60_09450, partial [Acidobacteria bacterium]|nr:hypothetical protein [Acidobacteriota bacterium]